MKAQKLSLMNYSIKEDSKLQYLLKLKQYLPELQPSDFCHEFSYYFGNSFFKDVLSYMQTGIQRKKWKNATLQSFFVFQQIIKNEAQKREAQKKNAKILKQFMASTYQTEQVKKSQKQNKKNKQKNSKIFNFNKALRQPSKQAKEKENIPKNVDQIAKYIFTLEPLVQIRTYFNSSHKVIGKGFIIKDNTVITEGSVIYNHEKEQFLAQGCVIFQSSLDIQEIQIRKIISIFVPKQFERQELQKRKFSTEKATKVFVQKQKSQNSQNTYYSYGYAIVIFDIKNMQGQELNILPKTLQTAAQEYHINKTTIKKIDKQEYEQREENDKLTEYNKEGADRLYAKLQNKKNKKKHSNYRNKIENYQKLLTVYQLLEGKYSLDYQKVRCAIASVYYYHEKYQLAKLILMEIILLAKENSFVEKNIYVVKAYDIMGKIYRKFGNFQEAKKCFYLSWNFNESFFPNNKKEMAQRLNKIGIIQFQLQNQGQSKKAFERMLKIVEQLYGSDNIEYVKVLINLGIVNSNNLDRQRAQHCLTQALQIFKSNLINRHPLLVVTLFILGRTYCDQGRFQKALQTFRKCKKIAEVTYGKNPDRIIYTRTCQIINNIQKKMSSNIQHISI